MRPVKPADDIGPAYVIIAVVLMGAGLFFIAADIKAHGFGWPHLGGFTVVFLLFLAIARPKKFDMVVKEIASRAKFLSFNKDGE